MDIIDLARTVGRIEEKADQILEKQKETVLILESHGERLRSLEGTRKIIRAVWSVVVASAGWLVGRQ